MNKIFSAALACLLLLSSCYKDKGNYDYKSVGEITIEKDSIQFLYRVMMGAELVITPEFILNGVEEANLEYDWQISAKDATNPVYKTISTEKHLKYIVNDPVSTYNLRYKITDKKSGVSTFGYSEIEVTDAIARAYLLLCKVPGKPGEFDISAANEFPTIGRIVHEIYSGANGETIKDATDLIYITVPGRSVDFLRIFTKNGGETVSSFNMKYQGGAEDWFFESPSVLAPTSMIGDTYNGQEFLIVNNGGVHYIDGINLPRKARLRARMNDGSDYFSAGTSTLANGSGYKRYLFWDKLGERFLQWNSVAKQMQSVPTDAASTFNPDDMKGLTPIYQGGGAKDRCYNIMKDKSGKYFLYTFRNASTFYARVDPMAMDMVEVDDSELEFSKATAFAHSNLVEIIYYAVDNKIWIYNVLQKNRRLLYEDSDKTTRFVSLFHKDRYTYNVFAAANNGEKGKVLRIFISGTGDIAASTETRPKPYDEMTGYPEIVKMIHKYRGF